MPTESSLPSEPKPDAYPADHGWTPPTGPFGNDERCQVMLARYPCNYTREQHDPDLPPADVDVFGYRRRPSIPPEPSGGDRG